MPKTQHSGAPELRERVRSEARNLPGIYRFTGPRGELLYVGKSVKVRNRLLSYFRHGPVGKTGDLLRVAQGVEWEYIPTEFEALLREFRLIRAFRPRYNVQHRRDRRFAWVKVTDEPAPRLVATRRPGPGGLRLFGPFPAGRQLPATLRTLAHLTGVRDCSASTSIHFADQLDLLGSARAPLCPRGELGSCPAPCAAGVSEEAYGRGVARALAFLSGEDEAPLADLRRRMAQAAEAREFEMAARYRDRAESLEHLRGQIRDFQEYLGRLNFVYRVEVEGGAACYFIRGGRVVFSFREEGDGPLDAETLAGLKVAGREPIPLPEQLSDGEREELFLVARWFRTHPAALDDGVPLARYLKASVAP